MKKLLVLLYLILASWSVRAQQDSVRVSLLTCAPGTEIYELFGHTAIRYENPAEGKDLVFNYGIFSFNTPNFVLRFVKGETDYRLGVVPYSYFEGEYAVRGSSVYQQTLNLTDEEKQKSNDTSGYPLRSEQEQIPSPNHLLPFQLKPYNNASHNQQYAYTRQRRQWETRFCFFRLYIHHFRLTEYQRTNTVSLHNDRAPCRFQHIKRSKHLLSSVNGNIRLAAKTKINS